MSRMVSVRARNCGAHTHLVDCRVTRAFHIRNARVANPERAVRIRHAATRQPTDRPPVPTDPQRRDDQQSQPYAAPPPPLPALSGATLRAHLERAAEGLTYTSEIDAPFEFVSAPRRSGGGGGPLTAREVATLFGAGAEEPVGERTLDAFFARHIERVDPHDAASLALAPRYAALKAALGESLGDARAVRVGSVEVRCYVVGLDARGDVAGLATRALET
jgi:hypothetical protein